MTWNESIASELDDGPSVQTILARRGRSRGRPVTDVVDAAALSVRRFAEGREIHESAVL